MGDYIERQAALDLIESAGAWGWSKNQLYEEMQSLPEANVRENVYAEWVPCYELHNVLRNDGTIFAEHIFVGYRCSICGGFERDKEPFCNCGAKMDEKGETT